MREQSFCKVFHSSGQLKFWKSIFRNFDLDSVHNRLYLFLLFDQYLGKVWSLTKFFCYIKNSTVGHDRAEFRL